jgi:hypothetical protein
VSDRAEHPGYATARDVARIYEVSVGYVYRLASAKHWRRYVLDGHVRYHRDDVDKTFIEVRS